MEIGNCNSILVVVLIVLIFGICIIEMFLSEFFKIKLIIKNIYMRLMVIIFV